MELRKLAKLKGQFSVRVLDETRCIASTYTPIDVSHFLRTVLTQI